MCLHLKCLPRLAIRSLHLKLLIKGWDRHLSNYRNLLAYTSKLYIITIQKSFSYSSVQINYLSISIDLLIQKRFLYIKISLMHKCSMPPLYHLHPYTADRSHRLTYSPNRNKSNQIDYPKLTSTWDIPCRGIELKYGLWLPSLKSKYKELSHVP